MAVMGARLLGSLQWDICRSNALISCPWRRSCVDRLGTKRDRFQTLDILILTYLLTSFLPPFIDSWKHAYRSLKFLLHALVKPRTWQQWTELTLTEVIASLVNYSTFVWDTFVTPVSRRFVGGFTSVCRWLCFKLRTFGMFLLNFFKSSPWPCQF